MLHVSFEQAALKHDDCLADLFERANAASLEAEDAVLDVLPQRFEFFMQIALFEPLRAMANSIELGGLPDAGLNHGQSLLVLADELTNLRAQTVKRGSLPLFEHIKTLLHDVDVVGAGQGFRCSHEPRQTLFSVDSAFRGLGDMALEYDGDAFDLGGGVVCVRLLRIEAL